ncbi:MAG TPA: hypothetical protein VJU79_08075, partial [Candidatus Dormibacteraeota bacterium]|nr:hypothetical protein [Candidatus Dormibacteraeota bacterium]
MHMEGIGRWAVVAATCVAIAACGSSAKASTPTASQLLSAARSNLDGLASYRVAGSVTAAEVSVQLTATVLKNGDSSGSITSAGVAKFVVVQRAVYFDTLTPAVTGALDKSMLDLAVRLKGPHWWRTAGSTSTQRAMSLLTASGLAPVFLDGRTKLTETSTKDSKGRAAYKLSDNAGSLFVSRTTPYRVLEIATAPDYLAASTSNVDLVFDEFNAPASVSVPAGFVPLSQELLPPYFYVSSLDLVGKCNTGGCTIKGVVTAAT